MSTRTSQTRHALDLLQTYRINGDLRRVQRLHLLVLDASLPMAIRRAALLKAYKSTGTPGWGAGVSAADVRSFCGQGVGK